MSDTGIIVVKVPDVPPTATRDTGDESTAGSTFSAEEEGTLLQEASAEP